MCEKLRKKRKPREGKVSIFMCTEVFSRKPAEVYSSGSGVQWPQRPPEPPSLGVGLIFPTVRFHISPTVTGCVKYLCLMHNHGFLTETNMVKGVMSSRA